MCGHVRGHALSFSQPSGLGFLDSYKIKLFELFADGQVLDANKSGLGAGLSRRLREMGFGARAMVQELSGTLDALQDKPEPIGHALELQESQKNTFPGYLLAERVFPAICSGGPAVLSGGPAVFSGGPAVLSGAFPRALGSS